MIRKKVYLLAMFALALFMNPSSRYRKWRIWFWREALFCEKLFSNFILLPWVGPSIYWAFITLANISMGFLYGLHVIFSRYIFLIMLHTFDQVLVGEPRMDDILEYRGCIMRCIVLWVGCIAELMKGMIERVLDWGCLSQWSIFD